MDGIGWSSPRFFRNIIKKEIQSLYAKIHFKNLIAFLCEHVEYVTILYFIYTHTTYIMYHNFSFDESISSVYCRQTIHTQFDYAHF